MFEGHIEKQSLDQTRDGQLLRQFRWTELVAKLSATRELREELARGNQAGEQGGFQAFGEIRREAGDESKDAVNQNGLTHGKSHPLAVSRAASGAVHGDREI